jgi:hypothetical protein
MLILVVAAFMLIMVVLCGQHPAVRPLRLTAPCANRKPSKESPLGKVFRK